MSNKAIESKEIDSEEFYAYFAPDGYFQARSVGETKEDAQYYIAANTYDTYKDYERKGFVLRKISLTVKVID